MLPRFALTALLLISTSSVEAQPSSAKSFVSHKAACLLRHADDYEAGDEDIEKWAAWENRLPLLASNPLQRNLFPGAGATRRYFSFIDQLVQCLSVTHLLI
jgi:hypothetical protein